MRESQPSGDPNHRPQARPFGSSGLAAGLAVGVFILAILIAGVLVLGGNNDQEEFGLASNTPTPATAAQATPEIGEQSTATPQPGAQASPTAAESGATPRIFPTLTPSATAPADQVVDDEPTPTAADSGAAPTDDPADDDPPAIEPTSVPAEDPPAPVSEPVAGDFGYLPPPQLPSGGAGQSITLDYQLATSLELVPESATVYQIVWPSFSSTDVERMALNLGITGEVTGQGDGVYNVSDAEHSLFVASTIIEFGTTSGGDGGPLPSANVAIDAAWAWFSALGIGGVSAGDGSVVAVEESAGLSVVSITPASPAPNLAPTPSARIKVSAGGVVEEARVVWPSSLIGSDYGLRPALELWEDLRNGYSFVSADLSASGGGHGTMSVTDISIEYTVSGSPWDTQYIVPLVVFGGTADVNGVSVYVSAYVPAVYHQGNPLG
jgi:hypothetical protein